MNGRRPPFIVAVVLALALSSCGEALPVDVIPYPAQVEGDRRAMTFDGVPVVRAAAPDDAELARLARHGAELLDEALGIDGQRREPSSRKGEGIVTLILDPAFADTSQEAYGLEVGRRGVDITARGHAGLFYGLQSLRQLVRPGPPSGWAVPRVRIVDRPRFAWRGMHLDVARHFFPVEVVKAYIDHLARSKLNTFHWHLTEDQGWRIEIERYPLLTEVGAIRRETMVDRNFTPYVGDGIPHGGFYSKEEVREVVAYAAERYVTVVPEIEMPGHALAALAAYPELACTPGPFEVATTWGVFEDVFCPTERTFTFLENVLTEVMELFPGPWIHIGGDEVPRTRWQESEEAQAVMLREGLADEDELQSWFVARIERFLHAHGRRLVGWDEILEGGLPPRAAVMSWRGTAGGIEAARMGHDVVMTPTGYAYFDYYQGDPETEPLAIGGFTPLEQVYAFEPVPGELSANEARHILGPQANLWTEYVKTPEHLEYMLFPRLLALAEVAWSPRERRDWLSFEARLPAALHALDHLGVNYRIPEVRGLDGDRLVLDSVVTVELRALHPGGSIRFTTDGSEPGPASPLYAGPFALSLDGPVEVRARPVLPDGREGPEARGTFRRTVLRPASAVDEAALAAGLRYVYFERQLTSVWDLPEDARPESEGVSASVALRGTERPENFALQFTGYLRVPEDGVYRFTLLSDDGSVLEIGGEVVVDHDGLHGPSEKAGEVALARGHHPFTVHFFQAGGGRALELFVTPPGGVRGPVPAEWFLLAPSGAAQVREDRDSQ